MHPNPSDSLLSGLLCNNDSQSDYDSCVPLLSVEVKAAVVHAVGQVEITQVYRNDKSFPIETIYFFPLDSCAAVTFFQAEFNDGTIVKGIVKTNEEAERAYKEAVENHHTAFLGSQVKPDIFNIRVGHLNPGVEVKVVIGYVTEVKNEGSSSFRFVLPTTIAPRYTPSGHQPISDGTNLMQHTRNSDVPLAINLAVSTNEEIHCIKSPTHSIVSELCSGNDLSGAKNWNKWNVSLRSVVTQMDRDFVVLITLQEILKPILFKSKREGDSEVVMFHMIPSFKLKDEQKFEFIIIIDRSGSMQGNSIGLAKQALVLFLHSLPEDCYFNVVGFGSSFEVLFPEGSRKYDQSSLGTAMAHAKSIGANLGGTEMAEMLKQILSLPLCPSYPRQIFLLTDGEISNTGEVIGIVKRHSHVSRVFTLGIGSSASTHLVRGIAAAGGGTCAFVESNENVATKVLRHLKDAIQPALSEVSLEWTGLTEEEALNTEKSLFGYNKPVNQETTSKEKHQEPKYFQAPRKIPPIFDGSQLLVVGIFPNAQIPTGLKITAQTPDGPSSLELLLSEDCCTDLCYTSMLHKMAAVKVIQELEAEETYEYFGSSGLEVNSTRNIQQEITELSLKNGIVSKYTSFIAVKYNNEHSLGYSQAPMEKQVIPSLIPEPFDDPFYCFPTAYERQSSPRSPSRMRALLPADLFAKISRTMRSVKIPEFRKLSLLPGGGMFGSSQAPGASSASQASDSGIPGPTAEFESDSADVEELQGKRGLQSADATSVERNHLLTQGSLQNKSNPKYSLSDCEAEVQALVVLQNFDGSFNLTEELCELLGLGLEKILKEIRKMKWNDLAFATCLAILHLSKHLSNQKYQWELVAKKSENWLEKNFPVIRNEMTKKAEEFI